MPTDLKKTSEFSEHPELHQHLVSSSERAAHNVGLPQWAAEDIYQAVMLNLSRIPKEKLAEIDNLNAYIYKMAQNEALSFRLKRKHLQEEIDPNPSLYSDRFQGARRVENRVLLSDIWTHLNADERKVLQLLIFGCGEKEIATRLGITYDAARQKISRLRKSLRHLVFDTVE